MELCDFRSPSIKGRLHSGTQTKGKGQTDANASCLIDGYVRPPGRKTKAPFGTLGDFRAQMCESRWPLRGQAT